MRNEPDTILKIPGKVLACLSPGYLRVLLGHGLDMAEGGIPHDVPIELVPLDLRMPNSEFTAVIDRTNGQFTGVERQSDYAQDHGVMPLGSGQPSPLNESKADAAKEIRNGESVRKAGE